MLPLIWFFSFVRTKADPFPGFTCRNSACSVAAALAERGRSADPVVFEDAQRLVPKTRTRHTNNFVGRAVDLDEHAVLEVVGADGASAHLAGCKKLGPRISPELAWS